MEQSMVVKIMFSLRLQHSAPVKMPTFRKNQCEEDFCSVAGSRSGDTPGSTLIIVKKRRATRSNQVSGKLADLESAS